MRKLGMTATQRMAVLKNQASDLIKFGRIETTYFRAKEVARYTEKLITLAMNTYEDKLEVTKTVKGKDGKEVEIKTINDGVKRLAARRRIMAKLNDLPELKKDGESKADFKARTKDINHPVIEKLFGELAPKYAARKAEKGQGGGYTRVLKLGQRRGDAAETAIVELI